MLRPITSLAYRLAVFCALGMLAAGCSANNTPSVATLPNTTSSQNNTSQANAVATRKTADMLVTLPAPSTTTTRAWISSDASTDNHAVIYWGDLFMNTINIFSAEGINPPLQGQITDGVSEPQRLFVDAKLNVWATNTGNNTITGYKREGTKPFLTISNGVEGPTGITVDAAGTLYCANTQNRTITEYPIGQTSPSLTISMPPLLTPEYLATDRHGNLYVQYLGGPTLSGVMKYPRGSTSGTDLGLVIGSADSVEVDRAGNVIVIDFNTNQIDIFAPGQTTPSKQIAVTAGTPFALSLNGDESVLYATVETSTGGFIVQDVRYPDGTTMQNKITNVTTDGDEWPIAVSPDAVF